MACLLHKWKGCKCVRCGKTRNKDHNFEPIPNECKRKCTICEEIHDDHVYVKGQCLAGGQSYPCSWNIPSSFQPCNVYLANPF